MYNTELQLLNILTDVMQPNLLIQLIFFINILICFFIQQGVDTCQCGLLPQSALTVDTKILPDMQTWSDIILNNPVRCHPEKQNAKSV